MDYLSHNMSIYSSRGFGKAEEIKKSDVSGICVSVNQSGIRVPQVSVDGKKIFLHSKYEPYKEAERFFSEINCEGFDLYIIFGFAFAYHVEILLRKIPKDSIVLVLEKDFSMVRAAFESRDLQKVLSDERFLLVIDPSEDDISLVLKGKSSQRVSLVTHRGSYQAYGEYYGNILNLAKSYLSLKEVNIATLAKFEKTWSSNAARNIDRFLSLPGCGIYFGAFKMPAFVVAAGPSLTESLPFIKKNSSRALIIAVDTSYHILVKNGIEPHICLCVDPQPVNARYFESMSNTRTVLVADPTVHPTVFRYFKGKIALCGMAFDMMKWIEKISGDKGEVAHGGSVSTNAYDFAVKTGAERIYMFGQDLSFTKGLAHARGSYLDEQIYHNSDRFRNVEMANRRQMKALPEIFVQGIKSHKVHTNQKMMIFLSWFQKRNNPFLFNATYDGAYISGIIHTREDEIDLPDETDIFSEVHRIYDDSAKILDSEALKRKALTEVSVMLEASREMVSKLRKAVSLSKEMLVLIERGTDRDRIGYIIRKLSEADKYIESLSSLKDMVGLTVQRVIHTITEGYDVAENGITEDVRVARRSLFLYEGLREGAVFTVKILNKMKTILVR